MIVHPSPGIPKNDPPLKMTLKFFAVLMGALIAALRLEAGTIFVVNHDFDPNGEESSSHFVP